jgi:UDP-2,4-diacetamido-2,4,6-trideoxy-beta-L-altropyranose hydrolase
MNILIRCDSSNIIGTGHIMRCLNLCEYTTENTYTFVCKNFSHNISQKILDASHNLILLDYCTEPELNKYDTWIGCTCNQELEQLVKIVSEKKYDQIIIDHYGIDWVIEKELSKYTNKLIVISDIYESTHWCDEFINYNSDNIELLTKLNLNPKTVIKCGAEHVIINKKFKQHKKISFRPKVEKMCIMLGGSDPFNYTLQILEQINNLVQNNNIIVYVIIGKANTNVNSIKTFVSNYKNYILLFDINYDKLIQLYLDIDLCIGSLSITAYERLYLNIPQICLKIVDNQNIQQLQEFNICKINNLINQIVKLFF